MRVPVIITTMFFVLCAVPLNAAHATDLCIFRTYHKDCVDNGCTAAGGSCKRKRGWVDTNENGIVDEGEGVDLNECACVLVPATGGSGTGTGSGCVDIDQIVEEILATEVK